MHCQVYDNPATDVNATQLQCKTVNDACINVQSTTFYLSSILGAEKRLTVIHCSPTPLIMATKTTSVRRSQDQFSFGARLEAAVCDCANIEA